MIYYGNTVAHFNAIFRAILDTKFTLDAPGLAVFRHHGFVHIQVGTKGAGAFLIPGNDPDDGLRAFFGTGPAAGAFGSVNVGDAVFAHCNSAKFTGPYAVAETLAAPGTALDASRGDLCRPAALYAYVFAFEFGLFACAPAGQNRHHGLYIGFAPEQAGELIRHRLSADRAGIYPGLPPRKC